MQGPSVFRTRTLRGIIPALPLSFPTSMQETEPWAVAASTRRRSRRRRRIAIRGWIALGALVAVGLTAGGGVLAYENPLPTSGRLNLKERDRGLPVYLHLVL